MEPLRKLRELLHYGLFVAALLPTLALLLAAGLCLFGGETVTAITLPAVPIYRAS